MIKGGSRDSELNALTVVPCGRFPSIAVTIDTGAHTEAIVLRKSSRPTTPTVEVEADGAASPAIILADPATAYLAHLSRRLLARYDTGAAPIHCTKRLVRIRRCARRPSVSHAKRALVQGARVSLDQGLVIEAETWLANLASPNRTEGLTAFLEKRPPRFVSE